MNTNAHLPIYLVGAYYTAPLAVAARLSWAVRTDVLAGICGDGDLAEHAGRGIYAKMYPYIAAMK